MKPVVYEILSRVCGIWGVGGATLSASDITDMGYADAFPGDGHDGKALKSDEAAEPSAARAGVEKGADGMGTRRQGKVYHAA